MIPVERGFLLRLRRVPSVFSNSFQQIGNIWKDKAEVDADYEKEGFSDSLKHKGDPWCIFERKSVHGK